MQYELIQRIDGALTAIGSLKDDIDDICSVVDAVTATIRSGGTLYTCGNGGSAAQALHLAEELIGRYRGGDRPPFRAICLNADAAALTCIANDFGFEHVFDRQCEALLTDADTLAVLSTSGNSPNVVNALNIARARNAATIGLLGKDGGTCASLCEHRVVVPGDDTAHIQEAHQVIIHLICESLERGLGRE